MKDKKLLKEVYTTPKEFAECIDTIFSNNVDKIAHYFGVEADRDNISVDMFMEWLIENGTNYADFIGFVDSFYQKPKNWWIAKLEFMQIKMPTEVFTPR